MCVYACENERSKHVKKCRAKRRPDEEKSERRVARMITEQVCSEVRGGCV